MSMSQPKMYPFVLYMVVMGLAIIMGVFLIENKPAPAAFFAMHAIYWAIRAAIAAERDLK